MRSAAWWQAKAVWHPSPSLARKRRSTVTENVVRAQPAAGQGAVALQCRAGESARFAAAGCARTTFSVTVERLFLAKLGEGCHTAFACHHAADRISLFRDDFGRRDVDFPATDLLAADALADRILRDLRLRL
jgi:hydroxymethylbilane synthase